MCCDVNMFFREYLMLKCLSYVILPIVFSFANLALANILNFVAIPSCIINSLLISRITKALATCTN